jgi:hypothetical protein
MSYSSFSDVFGVKNILVKVGRVIGLSKTINQEAVLEEKIYTLPPVRELTFGRSNMIRLSARSEATGKSPDLLGLCRLLSLIIETLTRHA